MNEKMNSKIIEALQRQIEILAPADLDVRNYNSQTHIDRLTKVSQWLKDGLELLLMDENGEVNEKLIEANMQRVVQMTHKCVDEIYYETLYWPCDDEDDTDEVGRKLLLKNMDIKLGKFNIIDKNNGCILF